LATNAYILHVYSILKSYIFYTAVQNSLDVDLGYTYIEISHLIEKSFRGLAIL